MPGALIRLVAMALIIPNVILIGVEKTSASQEVPKIYVVASPPSSQVGLVFKGRYYSFSRQPPEEPCDLRFEGACYQKNDAKFKQISEHVISINGGKAFGCAPTIIPDTSKKAGYENGYGECTSKGWQSVRNTLDAAEASGKPASTSIPSASGPGGSQKIYRGEGNTLEAYVGLERSNNFRFHMSCQKNSRERTFSLGVWFEIDAIDKVSSEVSKLVRVPENTEKELSVCLNGFCASRTWTAVGGGNCENGKCIYDLGDSMSLRQDQKGIRSLRIVVPNDPTNYEYRGDVDGILRRICREG